uniref:Uncharacterized protein n=1 Tax=Anguilla anguilla TaxID=7936 RepID=A0A0E9SYC8_ANGAN
MHTQVWWCAHACTHAHIQVWQCTHVHAHTYRFGSFSLTQKTVLLKEITTWLVSFSNL